MEVRDDLLLTLYRAARELPDGQFQDFALRLVKPLLQFESSMWGTGRLMSPGIAPHTVHLHEIPSDHVIQWQSLNPHDKVIPAVVANPGEPLTFRAPTLFSVRNEIAMRDFAKRAGWQSAMVTAFVDPQRTVIQWVSLYRPDPDHIYADEEQQLARFLIPHFVEALQINRALHLRSVYGESAGESGYLAYADRQGLLHYMDPEFINLILAEWPSWGDRCLPTPLHEQIFVNRKAAWIGRTFRLEARHQGELVFLRARRRTAVDRLSPRELEVARQFSQGQSHKEIARTLNLSPATVRHHLSAIYTKLDAHDKAQLAQLMLQRK